MAQTPTPQTEHSNNSLTTDTQTPSEKTDNNDQPKWYTAIKFCMLFISYIFALTVASITRLTQGFINWVLTEER